MYKHNIDYAVWTKQVRFHHFKIDSQF